jgi:hypothetical protein
MDAQDQDMDVLAAKLVARALHDVAGPTSGLTAALDLLGDTGGDETLRAEALALARESLSQIGDKIAFCRAAFAGGAVEGAALARLIQAPFVRSRAHLEAPDPPADAPPALQPALLILSLIASESLATGGEAKISLSHDSGLWRLRLMAQGARARLSPETRRGLEGGEVGEGLAGRWAPARRLRALVARSGGDIDVETEAERIAVCLTLPG